MIWRYLKATWIPLSCSGCIYNLLSSSTSPYDKPFKKLPGKRFQNFEIGRQILIEITSAGLFVETLAITYSSNRAN
jgi:hypothetical protein